MKDVVVVGAGGLGGPIALALAAAGMRVTVCDDDHVEVSNLHRQVQFGGADLERNKAEALAAAIERRGGAARAVAARFDGDQADRLAGDAAVVVDGSDDPATKFAVADWAGAHRTPYVIASALRYGGNVFTGAPGRACYRCLFEDVPDESPTCADAGVLGPVVGWVGGVAAREVLAVAGDPGRGGRIWVLDDLRRGPPRALALERRPGCRCRTW